MLAPLLLLAAAPETAIDAERAFNAAAQTEGQWTAFRKFMTDDAVVFTPQPQKAKDALPAKDPPVSVKWSPADSYVSCDGNVAVNTGPWERPGAVGYFTTVWVRQADGHFKWVVDGGDTLNRPQEMPEQPRIHKASCEGKATGMAFVEAPTNKWDSGASGDQSLVWQWVVSPDGARTMQVWLWDGRNFVNALGQRAAAPK